MSAVDVADFVLAGGHVAGCGAAAEDVDGGGEEVGFSVVAAEILFLSGSLASCLLPRLLIFVAMGRGGSGLVGFTHSTADILIRS